MNLYTTLKDIDFLNVSSFPIDDTIRLNVRTNSVEIPLLIVRRAHADQLCVLSNAAVGLDKTNGEPVFQRSSWWREIRHHQIYLCDPATVGPNAVPLAWGQVNLDYWIVPDAVLAIRSISNLFGVQSPHQRIYFGSSGGGFLSIALSAHDIGSRAIVNNTQFDWTRWIPRTVNTLLQKRMDGVDLDYVVDKLPSRTNVLKLLETLPALAGLDYWVNKESDHDLTIDLPLVTAFIQDQPHLAQNIRIHRYSDHQAGHNALDKETTVDLINNSESHTEPSHKGEWRPLLLSKILPVTNIIHDEKPWSIYGLHEDDHIFKSIKQMGTFYEIELLEHLERLLESDDLVIDAGANIGNHTLWFAGVLGCNVRAFEPISSIVQLLTKNVQLNLLSDKVRVEPYAVGATTHRASIEQWNDNNTGQTRLVEDRAGNFPVVALDDLHFDRPVRLIKIDVEGMEMSVLQGAVNLIRKDHPFIVAEAQDPEADRMLRGWFKEHSYEVTGVFNITPTLVAAHVSEVYPDTDGSKDRDNARIIATLEQVLSRFTRLEHRIDILANRVQVSAESLKSAAIPTIIDDNRNSVAIIATLQHRVKALEDQLLDLTDKSPETITPHKTDSNKG